MPVSFLHPAAFACGAITACTGCLAFQNNVTPFFLPLAGGKGKVPGRARGMGSVGPCDAPAKLFPKSRFFITEFLMDLGN